MPVITQTSNLASVWNGTIPVVALATGVTHYRLYCAQNADQAQNYRLVKEYVNPGAGNLTLGPLRYPDLFLVTPTRKFYLRAVEVRSGQQSDLVGAASPALMVAPSAVKGWSLEQLLEQEVRPVMIVGYDPTNNLFYPVNVVPSGGGGYKLET